MGKFKVGDRVRAQNGAYEGNTPGSAYNLPRTDGLVVEIGEGFVYLDYNGTRTPPLAPDCFELVQPAGPVRTVIRKEIVGGKFGNVVVTPLTGVSDKKVGIAVLGTWANALALDATELRTAAATLVELAAALEAA